MKILVTGGAGYIGSALVDKLISEKYEVNVLDDLSNGLSENINLKANFINGSILDEHSLDIALEGVEAVFHLAAKISVEEGESNPDLYENININGTLKLIEKCNTLGIRKFLFASTAAVYGNPIDFPLTEDSKVEPVNVYGKTKLYIDAYLAKNSTRLSMSSISFRFFNVAGAIKNNDGKWLRIKHDDATHLIPRILKSNPNSPLRVYGNDWPTSDGTAIRDFIHIKDLIDALLKALHVIGIDDHQVINLGTAKGESVLKVIEVAEKVLNKGISYVFTSRRPGDSFALVASNSKAKNYLNWSPNCNLKDIIEDAYRELISNN